MRYADIPFGLTPGHAWLHEGAAGRIPHAQLLVGAEGSAALPLALAYAQRLLCSTNAGDDSCGTCPSCLMANKLAHPDLHFSFPVIKRDGDSSAPISDHFLPDWRTFLSENSHPVFAHWLDFLRADNKQATFYVEEAKSVLTALALKPHQGGKKVLILWMPEKMPDAFANKLLKTIEEPEGEAVLLLVTHDEESVLPTISSRCQRLFVPPVSRLNLENYLRASGTDAATATLAAMGAGGALGMAQHLVNHPEGLREFAELLALLLRSAYKRSVVDLHQWSESVAGLIREKQKAFFQFTLETLSALVANKYQLDHSDPFALSGISFSMGGFSKLVSTEQFEGLRVAVEEAEYDIARNGNAKIVLMDFSLQVLALLSKKN
jgi:DNA polymerase-3 subunit delta'